MIKEALFGSAAAGRADRRGVSHGPLRPAGRRELVRNGMAGRRFIGQRFKIPR